MVPLGRKSVSMAKLKTISIHGWWVMAMLAFLALAWLPSAVDMVRAHQHRAETYFEVARVSVGNSVLGDPLIMDVDRTIHRPFAGSWAVEVRTFPERSVYCTGAGDVIYRPEAELPKPVTLEWWTLSQRCKGPVLPADEYIIVTTWTIHSPARGVPDQTVTIESNPFTVNPGDPVAAFDQIQQLEKEIEKLRAEE